MTIQELVEEENQRVIVLTPRQLKEFAMTILEAEHQQLSSIIKMRRRPNYYHVQKPCKSYMYAAEPLTDGQAEAICHRSK
jgi:hypothetical protein